MKIMGPPGALTRIWWAARSDLETARNFIYHHHVPTYDATYQRVAMLRMIAALFVTINGLHARLTRALPGVPNGAGLNSGYQPPSQPPRGAGAKEEPSGMAYATLGLGIASWFFLPVVAAIVGAIIGWVELKKIERGESPAKGKSVTQVGFWLSVANIALTVLGTCAAVAVVVFVFGGLSAAMAAAGLSEAAGH